MTPQIQVYGLLLLAILLTAAATVATGSAWRHLARLRANFGATQSESFHLAELVQARMPVLDEALLRFDATLNPADLAAFLKASKSMTGWIRSNRFSVTSTGQAALLGQIQAALGLYTQRAVALAQESQRTPSKARPVSEGLKTETAHILNLAAQLRLAEQAALTRFMEESNHTIASLQRHLAGSVIVIFVLGLMAARLTQLAKIAPLSAKLAETSTALERHEKLASLGTLAAGVAHEIRNPLTAIKVRLHSLNRSLAEGSEREDALVINQEIQRLERIVQDFLQFARPSAPQVETVSATILFEQVKRLLGAQLDNGHLELKIDCPAEIRVRADPQQIEQVLINLVQNAAESMAGGGSITLRASTKPPLLAGRQSQVLLDVIDTGQGIAPEIQNRLFDPFFSTKEGGAGLGLSIATRIVERHGGWLRYKTQLGRGTTFSFILPGAPESKHED